MSRYEWESGTVKLPTAEFSRVRRAVAAADRAYKEEVFAHAQTFWKSLTRDQKTHKAAYNAAARLYVDRVFKERQRTLPAPDRTYSAIENDLNHHLGALCYGAQAKPRRLTMAEMEYPTNRTVAFAADDASLDLDRKASTVFWDVPNGNRAVAAARAHPIGVALFTALNAVTWTRGTGGVLVGNDEYNSDVTYEGGGGNYTTGRYGPLGDTTY